MSPRFLRYLVTGATATAAHYLMLILIVAQGGIPLLGSIVGSVVGLLTNYFLSSRWVFARTSDASSRFARFLAVSVLAFGLNAAFMWIGLRAGLHYLLAQVLSTFLLMLINYTLHANWTFLNRESR
jgi:putative flippase GtrA